MLINPKATNDTAALVLQAGETIKSIPDPDVAAQLAEMRATQATLQAQLDTEKIARVSAEADAETQRRRSLRVEMGALFEDALHNHGTVWPSERELWMGEIDDKGGLVLLDDGTPKRAGKAVTDPDHFRAYLATQQRKHSSPVQGGPSIGPPTAGDPESVIRDWDARKYRTACEIRSANPTWDMDTATGAAHKALVAQDATGFQHYRDALKTRRAPMGVN